MCYNYYIFYNKVRKSELHIQIMANNQWAIRESAHEKRSVSGAFRRRLGQIGALAEICPFRGLHIKIGVFFMVSQNENTAVLEHKPLKPLSKDGITDQEWFKKISLIGELLFNAAKAVMWKIAYSILWLVAAFWRGWERVVKFFKRIAPKLAAPFKRYAKAHKMNCAEIVSAKKKKGITGAAGAAVKVTHRVLFGKRGVLVSVANWVLPILSCVFLFNVISYTNKQAYALKLTVNGDFIGYIDNESIFNDAESMVQKRINYSGSSTEIIDFSPTYEVDTISSNTLNVYQVTDKMLSLVSSNIERGYGLYIGDEYFGTLTDHTKLDAALEDLLDKYRSDNEKESVKFDKEVSYIQGNFMRDSFVNENEKIELLTSTKEQSAFYTVEDGDSPGLIAQKVGLTLEELDSLNNGFTESTPVYTGDQVKITREIPFLSVMITREEHYSEEVEFETVNTETELYYKGFSKVEQNGVNGERAVVANVSYVNGVEVGRNVISSVITTKPTTKYVLVGTKDAPSTAGTGYVVEAGHFYWPVGGVGGGLISEFPAKYGGYYGHMGLDIGASAYTPIYAGDSGTVIEVVDKGRYWTDHYSLGNYVYIQHDNGYRTRYGHMIETTVSVGQRVTMGELIGYVGSTGYSTGNHCHFEVIYNNVRIDPVPWLPKHGIEGGVYYHDLPY